MSSAFIQNKKLEKGINIGNALEAPIEGNWGICIENHYFEKIKAKGFSSVRIPIRWSAHSLKDFPYTIDERFFNRIDAIIKTALGSDLVIVINIHHFEELFNSPSKNIDKYLSLWKQISERYKDSSDNLFFELLNEPHFRLTARRWNKLLKSVIPIIRATNPNRIIMVGPARWNNIGGLKFLKLPSDKENIIVTFHYYQPFIFTHQGAEWVKFSKLFLGRKWKGSNSEKRKISKHFNTVKEWSKSNNVPICLGEFGVYYKSDETSRILWTNEVAKQAEEFNFSWIYWEFGAGFGLYNIKTGKWNQNLLSQLIPQG